MRRHSTDYDLPSTTRGVLITRVEPLSAAFDAEVQRGTVLLEINRKPIGSAANIRRLAGAAARWRHPGAVRATCPDSHSAS